MTVTAVGWHVNGPPNCWGPSNTGGATVGEGQEFSVGRVLSYAGGPGLPGSCTVRSVSIATAGFTIRSTNTPLVVHSGGSATVILTIQAPGTTFAGTLAVDATATSP